MHYLPHTVFGSKDHRDPQGVRDDVLASIEPGLQPLYLYNAGKLRSYVLRHYLEANGLAISARRRGTPHGLRNLLPSTRDPATGIGEAHVVSMGEQVLHGLGVPFHELTQRQLILLDQFVYIIYGTHLEILSIACTHSFPEGQDIRNLWPTL